MQYRHRLIGLIRFMEVNELLRAARIIYEYFKIFVTTDM